jgi:hypothetical protein
MGTMEPLVEAPHSAPLPLLVDWLALAELPLQLISRAERAVRACLDSPRQHPLRLEAEATPLAAVWRQALHPFQLAVAAEAVLIPQTQPHLAERAAELVSQPTCSLWLEERLERLEMRAATATQPVA